ncbi:O-antigen ligase family protein [Brachybacterium sp. AG952]|uniref:O-antigen ligase family protein n=1 Tax=Brachybacterium sp. AG952 TaxID=2183989 RepID=UPI00141514D4|nr:O-antigen ligase family protein [Brachybacterium sp. AG952]
MIGLLVLAYIGYIKGAPLLSRSPVDLTFVGAGVVAVVLASSAHRLHTLPGLMPLIAMYVALVAGAVPSGVSTTYSSGKTLQILLLVPLCMLGGRIILSTEEGRQAWLRGVVILGLIVAVFALLFPDDTAAVSGRLSIEGGNTIGAGRGVGAAVTVLAVWGLWGRKRRAVAICVAASLVAVLLLIGSRGPILAAVVAIGVAVLVSRQQGKPIRLFIALVGFGVAAWVMTRESDVLSARLFTLEDRSSEARRVIWAESLRVAGDNPLGVGWGQLFAFMRPGRMLDSGVAQYPHNLILEVTVEAGWIPAIVLVVVIGYALFRQQQATVGTTETAMLALLVFALVTVMVSGDVPSNRGLWVALGAAMASPALIRERQAHR